MLSLFHTFFSLPFLRRVTCQFASVLSIYFISTSNFKAKRLLCLCSQSGISPLSTLPFRFVWRIFGDLRCVVLNRCFAHVVFHCAKENCNINDWVLFQVNGMATDPAYIWSMWEKSAFSSVFQPSCVSFSFSNSSIMFSNDFVGLCSMFIRS